MDVHVRAGGRITPPLLSACSYLVGHAIDYSGKARKINLESFSLKCHGQGIWRYFIVDCNSSFTFNFLFFHERINIFLAFFYKRIQVFLISKCKQITFLTSEKTKEALLLGVFCVIKRTMRGVLVFSRCIFYFLIKKLLERVSHASASGWRPRH
jgi:hypothetical protein